MNNSISIYSTNVFLLLEDEEHESNICTYICTLPACLAVMWTSTDYTRTDVLYAVSVVFRLKRKKVFFLLNEDFNCGKPVVKIFLNIFLIFQIYTDWANYYLERGGCKRRVTDLQADLCDGVLLADLVEAVSKCPRLFIF